jgi:hypothetical protein
METRKGKESKLRPRDRARAAFPRRATVERHGPWTVTELQHHIPPQ